MKGSHYFTLGPQNSRSDQADSEVRSTWTPTEKLGLPSCIYLTYVVCNAFQIEAPFLFFSFEILSPLWSEEHHTASN